MESEWLLKRKLYKWKEGIAHFKSATVSFAYYNWNNFLYLYEGVSLILFYTY